MIRRLPRRELQKISGIQSYTGNKLVHHCHLTRGLLQGSDGCSEQNNYICRILVV